MWRATMLAVILKWTIIILADTIQIAVGRIVEWLVFRCTRRRRGRPVIADFASVGNLSIHLVDTTVVVLVWLQFTVGQRIRRRHCSRAASAMEHAKTLCGTYGSCMNASGIAISQRADYSKECTRSRLIIFFYRKSTR